MNVRYLAANLADSHLKSILAGKPDVTREGQTCKDKGKSSYRRNLSPKYATVVLSAQHQNIDNVNKLVAWIARIAWCIMCGRTAQLYINFLSDPPQDLAQQ